MVKFFGGYGHQAGLGHAFQTSSAASSKISELPDEEKEFKNAEYGFRAAKHQSFVGTGYFDEVQKTIVQGDLSTVALKGSTEAEQFRS